MELGRHQAHRSLSRAVAGDRRALQEALKAEKRVKVGSGGLSTTAVAAYTCRSVLCECTEQVRCICVHPPSSMLQQPMVHWYW